MTCAVRNPRGLTGCLVKLHSVIRDKIGTAQGRQTHQMLHQSTEATITLDDVVPHAGEA